MILDKNSATAMAMRGILEPLIEAKRRSLERPSCSWEKTLVLRGELVALRRMYAALDLKPTEEATDE